MYVCSQNTGKTVHDSTIIFRATLLTILLRCAVSSFVQIGQQKILLKNQFPIQSSSLRENLINANNLSGIVRWSYLFFFEIIFSSTTVTTGTHRGHGSSRTFMTPWTFNDAPFPGISVHMHPAFWGGIFLNSGVILKVAYSRHWAWPTSFSTPCAVGCAHF